MPRIPSPSMTPSPTTLRVEIRRSTDAAPAQTKTKFEKYTKNFEEKMNHSIGLHENSMNDSNVLDPRGARRFRVAYFSVEGQKHARDKVLELLATMPPETDIADAMRKAKALMEELRVACVNATNHYVSKFAEQEQINDVARMQMGYSIAENCVRTSSFAID